MIKEKYTPKNTMDYILKLFPEYKDFWQKHLQYWEGSKRTIHSDINSFLSFTIDLIQKKDYKLLSKIMKVIETLLTNGDYTVNNAVSLSFLESLINVSSNRSGEVPYEVYIPLLGPESRKMCKELDEFWGSKTPGLWDKNEGSIKNNIDKTSES